MKKILFLLLLIAAGGLAYRNWDKIQHYLKNSSQIQQLVSNNSALSKLNQEINTPGPLTGALEARTSKLTVAGTIAWTNQNRKDNGLPALKENSKLDQSAMLKAQDMFDKQYFEHVSPSGAGPGDLADKVDYQYIAIGENLALGNFKDDEALVTAWMNSPGHRANILNTKYTEIGVAVLKGTYEGHTVWMAVQEFGRPVTDCPSVDQNLKAQVASYRSDVDTLEPQIKTLKAEIDAMDPHTHEEYNAYNKKVSEYNALVKEYNNKIDILKNLIVQYNAQVNAFNACVGGSS